MRLTSSHAIDERGIGWSRRTWAAVLGVALLAGCAWAQQSPPASKPKDATKEKPAQAEAIPSSPSQNPSRATPKGGPATEGMRPAGSVPSVAPRETPPPSGKAKEVKPDKPSKPARKGTARPGKRHSAQTLKPDPNAKWACEAPTQTQKPVWRGDKKLTFTFHIRNEGTADLQIKAKGG